MLFKSKKVQQYIESGAVYVATIRVCGIYEEGMRVKLRLVDSNRILDGRVVKIAELTEAEKYVNISGFDNVNEWFEEAKKLHGTENLDGYCIVVVRITR